MSSALHTRHHPYRATNWPPLRNSDGATYAELHAKRLAKVRELARLEGFFNEARDWEQWGWYHQAKGLLRGMSAAPLDRRKGTLYEVTKRASLDTAIHLQGD